MSADVTAELPEHGAMTLAARALARVAFPELGFHDPVAEGLWRALRLQSRPPRRMLEPACRRTASIDRAILRAIDRGAASMVIEIEGLYSTRLPWIGDQYRAMRGVAVNAPSFAVERGWLMPGDRCAEIAFDLDDGSRGLPRGLRIPEAALLVVEHGHSAWTRRVLRKLAPHLPRGTRLVAGSSAPRWLDAYARDAGVEHEPSDRPV